MAKMINVTMKSHTKLRVLFDEAAAAAEVDDGVMNSLYEQADAAGAGEANREFAEAAIIDIGVEVGLKAARIGCDVFRFEVEDEGEAFYFAAPVNTVIAVLEKVLAQRGGSKS